MKKTCFNWSTISRINIPCPTGKSNRRFGGGTARAAQDFISRRHWQRFTLIFFFCLPRQEIYRRSVIRMYKSIRKSCNCCITKCIYFSFRFSLCASSEHFLKIFFRRREDAMTAMKLLLRMSKHVLPPFNIFPNELISNYSQFAPKEEMVNYEARLQ